MYTEASAADRGYHQMRDEIFKLFFMWWNYFLLCLKLQLMYSDKIERVGRLERVGSYKHTQIYICSALAANYVVHFSHV